MLTKQENEYLTRVGPGTPMGALLRRYWYPIAALDQMADRWTKRVRILGEDLVLFKDRRGRFGLIAEACPHRRASLAYGIPTDEGIRCPYHGWMFDGTGQCLEQPNEPAESTFKDKVRTSGYPVEELGGLLWSYLGPQPAPLLPRYDGLVAEGSIRAVGLTRVRANWLQIMENSCDPVHTEWLHGKLFEFVREQAGEPTKVAIAHHHKKIAFVEFEHGLIKRRLMEGQREDCDDWTVGHPIVFPNTLAVGSGGGKWKSYSFQIRVPVDDVTTDHYWYDAFVPPAGADVPTSLLAGCPSYDAPQLHDDGTYKLEAVYASDVFAWETQGAIADRDQEALGWTDHGITMFRKMLRREIANIEEGRDPLGVIRDPAQNVCVDLPLETDKDMFSDGFETLQRNIGLLPLAPIWDDLLAVYRNARRPPTPAGVK
jgi:5,5'-dehydrodivanillate O-demethylase